MGDLDTTDASAGLLDQRGVGGQGGLLDQRPDPVFHWFLPTGGDSRVLSASSHGFAIGSSTVRTATGGDRPASLSYLTQIAHAAEDVGFTGLLTPTGSHCLDAWLVTSALLAATHRVKFLVAFRPGVVQPRLAADFVQAFQQLSDGRLLLNVVVGGSAAEQRSYGDFVDHDGRYARAEEFLDIVDRLLDGDVVDHEGDHFRLTGASLGAPVTKPAIYLGGSSTAAVEVAARRADVFLTWGEPPAQVAEKIAGVRAAAAREGRTVRCGIRLHVIARETAAQAWARADELISGLDEATIAARQEALQGLESVGQQRMLALHGGRRDRLEVAPNLWAGLGLVRGGAGTALVGSHDEVAARLEEYRDLGIDEFILSGYPHLEEAYEVGEQVLPRVAARVAHAPTTAASTTEVTPSPASVLSGAPR